MFQDCSDQIQGETWQSGQNTPFEYMQELQSSSRRSMWQIYPEKVVKNEQNPIGLYDTNWPATGTQHTWHNSDQTKASMANWCVNPWKLKN